MLGQNQTTFSASHVQAYWAHLDHVVYKNEVSEHKAPPEAVAEKQPRSRKELYLPLAKEQQEWLLKSALTGGRHRTEARSRSNRHPQSLSSLLHFP